MPLPLPDTAKRLLDAPTFVTVSTVNPDGGPQATVVWVKREGDDVLFSTVRGRRKERNLARDPRISLSFFDPANSYWYTELRGAVTVTEDGGPELIQELSQKYNGVAYTHDGPDDARVVVRLTPEKIVGR